MEVREIRKFSGLTQKEFAERYHIPLTTLKSWETSIENKSHRKPPKYVTYLLEQSVFRKIEDDMLRVVKKEVEEKERALRNEEVNAAAKALFGEYLGK